MANWHALVGTDDANAYRIVYHIPVPNTNNAVAVSYRTALINSGIGGKTVLPDGDGTLGTISSAEKTLIASGAIYEYVENFLTNPGQSLASLQAAVDVRFTALSAGAGAFLTGLSAKLKYFGATH